MGKRTDNQIYVHAIKTKGNQTDEHDLSRNRLFYFKKRKQERQEKEERKEEEKVSGCNRRPRTEEAARLMLNGST